MIQLREVTFNFCWHPILLGYLFCDVCASRFLNPLSMLSFIDLAVNDLHFCIRLLPRKEVIQPHLPIRLPCYDFTLVIDLAFDG